LGITGEESDMRNAVMVEHDETVIDGVETELGTNITNSDSLQRTVIFQTTDLDTERMGSEILSV
jgi:hypothetical protein